MAQFEKKFNYDDVFFRSITLGVIKEFTEKIKWKNTWHDKDKEVTIPFYYSMAGQERFLMDAFIDDIAGKRPELNIDPLPRAHIILETSTAKTNEYTNPNVKLLKYEEEDGQIKKTLGTYRVIPLKLTFKVDILLRTEIDMMKCQQAILDFFYIYKYFQIDYKFLRVDCNLFLPDALNTEFQREIPGLNTEDSKKKISFSVDVHTNYPVEPTESQTIPFNKKVVFKGKTLNLGRRGRKRRFLGDDNLQ